MLPNLGKLAIKFDTFKKGGNVPVCQHLHEMTNMIIDLEIAGHILTYKHKVQAAIHSLQNSMEHMNIQMTNNENIKIFYDMSHHLELKEHLEVIKSLEEASVAESFKARASRFKHKKNNNSSKMGKKKRFEN